jgi:mutator protein MutT
MARLPGYFGFWGGGLEEGETFEQGLIREVKEELGVYIKESEVEFFSHYEFLRTKINAYIYYPKEEWEKNIKIGEGEYGKWFTPEEIFSSENIILQDKGIINDLERRFLQKPIK